MPHVMLLISFPTSIGLISHVNFNKWPYHPVKYKSQEPQFTSLHCFQSISISASHPVFPLLSNMIFFLPLPNRKLQRLLIGFRAFKNQIALIEPFERSEVKRLPTFFLQTSPCFTPNQSRKLIESRDDFTLDHHAIVGPLMGGTDVAC